MQVLERVLALSYQLLAQLTAVKTMLLQRRDRLRTGEIRVALGQSAQRIASALTGLGDATPAAADSGTSDNLPDPFEQDLTPWLVRRLELAASMAAALRAEAGRAAT
jgi:hypothetical protein